ncbi:MAG: radical SAM protein [Planctomycetota bacterium]
MKTGIIFDVKEFAIHDGPGIRATVFLKGCPLRCWWCHNPEGQNLSPEIMHSPAGKRYVGKEYTSAALTELLNRQADILRLAEGGVTFSGGEPLMQSDFVSEVIDHLDNLHVILDTCGYASQDKFRQVAGRCNMIYFDLKIMDAEKHAQYARADNRVILNNLCVLATLDIPFVVRVPLVPDITDTSENFAEIASKIHDMPNLVGVHLLSYNRIAGGKYKALDKEFSPCFNESKAANVDFSAFTSRGIEVVLL